MNFQSRKINSCFPVLLIFIISFISFSSVAQYCMPVVQDAGYGIGITRLRLNTTSVALSIDNSSMIMGGIGGSFGPRNVEDYTASDSATLEVGGVYRVTINSGLSLASDAVHVVAWIDYNHNNIFDNTEEVVYIPYVAVGSVTSSQPFFVPATVSLGRTRMRIVAEPFTYAKSTPCNDNDFGEVEDYTINIVNPYSNSSFVSCNVFQQNTTNASRGATNEMLGIKVVTNGVTPLMSFHEFTFNTNGSTAIQDITNAKLWFTGLDKNFATTQLVGSPFLNPNGNFTISFNQTLYPDSNYFWLTYDIVDTARTCQVVDAECIDAVIDGVHYIPNNSAPAGNRNITSNQFIPNPSFEDLSFCPQGVVGPGDPFSAVGWHAPTQVGTTDHYSVCSNIANGGTGAQGVPANSIGTQSAKSGNSYIGMQPAGAATEYLTAKLNQPLVIGRAYCASFYVSVADMSGLAVDGMGLAFTKDSLANLPIQVLSLIPKVVNPAGSFLTDKIKWVKISGSFIADSAYKYIVIGNFQHGGVFNTINMSSGINGFGYCYVDDISLIENPITEIAGDTLICPNDSAHFVAHSSISVGIKDLLYSWEEISAPGVILSTDSTLGVAPQGTKSYIVTVSSCGDSCVGGGKDTITLVVTQPVDPSITAPAPLCVFDPTYQLIAANPGGVWVGSGITNTLTGVFSPSLTGVGTHSVIYSISGRCLSADTINITVLQAADATISSAGPFCENSTPLSVLLNSANAGGVWSGTGILNAATGSFSPAAAGAGTHKIIYTIAGVCGDADSINVLVNTNPVVDAGINSTIQSGSSIALNGSGGTTYLWSPAGSLNCSTCVNPVASPLETTTYYVVVTDNNGCTNIDSVMITVEEIITECGNIYIPTAFSPNGDGQNDELKIMGTESLAYFYLRVYNRWGEKVFETTNADFSWDGNYKGKEQNTDTYIFKFEAKCISKDLISKSGNIYLLR